MNAKTKKIIGIIVNVLIWIFVVFSVIVTVLAFSSLNSEDGVPEIFGKSMITIQTPSMTPTFNVGDMVIMTKLDDAGKAALKKDDIITYRAPIDINGDGQIGDLNTHRIDTIQEDGKIITKGDNNTLKDNEGDTPYTITKNDIIGKCEEGAKVAGLGAVLTFLGSSLGFFLCVVLPLILFFIYELYRFIALILSERAKKAPVSKETEEEIKRRAIEEYLKAQNESANAAKPDARPEVQPEIKPEAQPEEKAESAKAEEAAADSENKDEINVGDENNSDNE